MSSARWLPALTLALLLAAARATMPSLGTLVIQGVLDAELQAVEEELVIPAGQCSGLVLHEDYSCAAGEVVSLGVEVRDAAGAPEVVVAGGLRAVRVVRAGACASEAAVALSRACSYAPPAPQRLVRAARPRRRRAIPPVTEPLSIDK